MSLLIFARKGADPFPAPRLSPGMDPPAEMGRKWVRPWSKQRNNRALSDVHDPQTRSRNMAAIRSANTKPEMIIRKGLHARGFRFRLHDKRLAGKPDLIFARYRAVIFVNGCFWHGHDCPLFRWPATREEFWRAKIALNMARDTGNIAALWMQGWRIATIWECALKGRGRRNAAQVIDEVAQWLVSDAGELELRGTR